MSLILGSATVSLRQATNVTYAWLNELDASLKYVQSSAWWGRQSRRLLRRCRDVNGRVCPGQHGSPVGAGTAGRPHRRRVRADPKDQLRRRQQWIPDGRPWVRTTSWPPAQPSRHRTDPRLSICYGAPGGQWPVPRRHPWRVQPPPASRSVLRAGPACGKNRSAYRAGISGGTLKYDALTPSG